MKDNNIPQNQNENNKQEKTENSDFCRAQKSEFDFGKLFLGLLIVFAGVFYLAKNFGILPENLELDIWRFWPVFLIYLGISMLDAKSFWAKIISIAVFFLVLAAMIFLIFQVEKTKNVPGLSIAPFTITKNNAINYSVVEIENGFGSVNIEGGAAELAEGRLETNNRKLAIDSKIDNETQRVNIKTEGDKKMSIFNNIESKLYARLNSEIPMELSLNLGLSDSKIDLSNVMIKRLNIDTGISSLNLVLGSKMANSEVNINAGISPVKISLPGDAGARIVMDSGFSMNRIEGFNKIDEETYKTPNYEESEKKIELNLDIGVSSLEIKRR